MKLVSENGTTSLPYFTKYANIVAAKEDSCTQNYTIQKYFLYFKTRIYYNFIIFATNHSYLNFTRVCVMLCQQQNAMCI
jgi:hypothetical protein